MSNKEIMCFERYQAVLMGYFNDIEFLKELKKQANDKYGLHCAIVYNFNAIFELSLVFLPYAFHKYEEQTTAILKTLQSKCDDWVEQIWSMKPQKKDRKMYRTVTATIDNVKNMCDSLLTSESSRDYIAKHFNELIEQHSKREQQVSGEEEEPDKKCQHIIG